MNILLHIILRLILLSFFLATNFHFYLKIRKWLAILVKGTALKRLNIFNLLLHIILCIPIILPFFLTGFENKPRASILLSNITFLPSVAYQITSIIILIISILTIIVSFTFYLIRRIFNKKSIIDEIEKGVKKDKRYRETRKIYNVKLFFQKIYFIVPLFIFLFNMFFLYKTQNELVVNNISLKIETFDNIKTENSLSIGLIADLHIGKHSKENKMEEIMQKVNELNTDLIVIVGDLLNDSADYLPLTIKHLKKLQAPLGVYFVMGNHDYIATSADKISQELERIGITVLINNSLVLSKNNMSFNLIGIDYPTEGWKHDIEYDELLETSLKTADPNLPSILLSHTPEVFDEAVKYGIDLTLAGHTHGGQISFGGDGENYNGVGALIFDYAKGLYEQGGKYLFVTVGAGEWFPIRINCPQEIVNIIVNEN